MLLRKLDERALELDASSPTDVEVPVRADRSVLDRSDRTEVVLCSTLYDLSRLRAVFFPVLRSIGSRVMTRGFGTGYAATSMVSRYWTLDSRLMVCVSVVGLVMVEDITYEMVPLSNWIGKVSKRRGMFWRSG